MKKTYLNQFSSLSKDNKVESWSSVGSSAASGGCRGYLAEERHEPGVSFQWMMEKIHAYVRLQLFFFIGLCWQVWSNVWHVTVSFLFPFTYLCSTACVCVYVYSNMCLFLHYVYKPPTFSVHAVGDGGAGEWTLGQLHFPRSPVGETLPLTVHTLLLSSQASRIKPVLLKTKTGEFRRNKWSFHTNKSTKICWYMIILFSSIRCNYPRVKRRSILTSQASCEVCVNHCGWLLAKPWICTAAFDLAGKKKTKIKAVFHHSKLFLVSLLHALGLVTTLNRVCHNCDCIPAGFFFCSTQSSSTKKYENSGL